MEDYYQILGVSKEATVDQIKKAYRAIAKDTHPDANQNSTDNTDKFKKAAEAYETLSNPKKKEIYDRRGSGNPFGHVGFDNIFSQAFRGSRRKRRRGRGANINVGVQITLEEVMTGARKEFKVYRRSPCKSCSGTGAENGEMVTCTVCNGRGAITKPVQTAFGRVEMEEDCYSCQGNGKKVKSPCKSCSGTAYTRVEETLSINIPRGSASGVSFVVPGKGDHIQGGTPGDVIVIVEEYFHPEYKRDGINLINTKELSFKEVCLGTSIEVSNLLGGSYKIKVPGGTQPGKIFRLKGKGVPEFSGIMNGDILVRINVKVPTELTQEQIELIEVLYISLEEQKPN